MSKLKKYFFRFGETMRSVPSERIILPVLFLGMLFKNFILQCFLTGGTPFVLDFTGGLESSLKGLVFNLATVMLLFSPVFLFKKQKGRLIYSFTVSVVFLVLTMIDGCYYRSFPEIPSVTLLGMFKGSGVSQFSLQAVLATFSVYDLFYFADYAFLALWGMFLKFSELARKTEEEHQSGEKRKEKDGKSKKAESVYRTEKRTKKTNKSRVESVVRAVFGTRGGRFFVTALPCALVLLALPLMNMLGLATKSYRNVFEPAFAKDSVLYFTPVGYHVGDIFKTITDMVHLPVAEEPVKPSGDDPSKVKVDAATQQILDFYAYNSEDLPDNRYKGLYKDKNVILIQVESLERFVLGQKVGGEEITPNLNRLIGKDSSSLYFTGIHDQAKGGNSSDCDLMINTSILPTSKVFFKNYSDRYLPSLPVLLRKNGYATYYLNGSGTQSFWPYTGVYRDIFGYNVDAEDPDCNFKMLDPEDESDRIYWYSSDEYTLNTALEKLILKKEQNGKFFSQIILCSSHTPFEYILEKMPEGKLPIVPEEKALQKNKVISYFNCLHYVDAQIGKFLENAEREGLLENSIVLIYGDHTGIHKYNPLECIDIAEKYEELAFIEEEEYPTIPLIIYDPSGQTEHTEIETLGGQVDIMPTLCYLLGMEREEYSFAMGRVLLNTGRNCTILPNGTMIGQVSEDAEEMLYRMYNTADFIVKKGYFKRISESETSDGVREDALPENEKIIVSFGKDEEDGSTTSGDGYKNSDGC